MPSWPAPEADRPAGREPITLDGTTMTSPALLAHDIVRTLGSKRVLDGVSLTAAPGHRIGLIGENGVGKSTLLRLLAGVDEPDGGSVTRPADVGFLHQEMAFDATSTIADVLDDALREAREDLAAIDRLTKELARTPQDSPGTPNCWRRTAAWLELAQERQSWDADRRAAVLLTGLGLAALPYERTLKSLSGGERGKLSLAALLVRRPSALLLDEPTNHLDDEAAAFVEEQLRGMPGPVVIASHDRAFLDAVCTDLIDLDPAVDGPVRYGGGYSTYLSVKRAERARWERRHAEEQEEIEALRRSADVTARQVAPDRGPRDSEKMGYGLRAGRVQSQIARRVRNASPSLAELERHRTGEPPQPLRFRHSGLMRRVGRRHPRIAARGAGAGPPGGRPARCGGDRTAAGHGRQRRGEVDAARRARGAARPGGQSEQAAGADGRAARAGHPVRPAGPYRP